MQTTSHYPFPSYVPLAPYTPVRDGLVEEAMEEDIQDNFRNIIARSAQFKKHNRIKKLERQIKGAEELHGRNRIGFLTLTMKKGATWDDLQAAIKKANRMLNQEFPDGWCRVAGIGENGNLHVHFVVITRFDIGRGFSFPVYDELKHLRANRAEWKLQREKVHHLTTNEALRGQWKTLRKKLEKSDFGLWMELTPLRDEPIAISCYMAENAEEVEINAKKPKGFRTIGFSRAFPNPPVELTERQIERKAQRAKLTDLLGGKEALQKQYGKTWALHLTHAIMLTRIPWFHDGRLEWNRYVIAIQWRLNDMMFGHLLEEQD